MKYILLNPDDVHQAGDEIWIRNEWNPLPGMYFGERVGDDGPPCRRAIKLKNRKAKTSTSTPL